MRYVTSFSTYVLFLIGAILIGVTFLVLPVSVQAQDDTSVRDLRNIQDTLTTTEQQRVRDVQRTRAPQDTVQDRTRDTRQSDIGTNERDVIQARQQELRQRLAQLQDRQKAALIERINNTLSNINQRMTSAWLNVINSMLNIATRLEDVADSDGEIALLDSAKTALELAQTSVEEQAEKDYTIIINDETTVREDVVTAKNALKSDLRAVREVVFDAKGQLAIAAAAITDSEVTHSEGEESTE